MKNTVLFALLLLAFNSFGQNKNEYKVAAIGFYNLENFFDTLDNVAINDEDFLPKGKLLWDTKKYTSKVGNMAKVISQLGTELTPDGVAILGVAEVENRKVLEDLVAQPTLADRNYQIVHFDSPDERGIDVGLLYQPKYFTVLDARPVHVQLTSPTDGTEDKTRDILFVSGTFDGDPLHIMVCHWPSRRGGEKASAWARATAAGICRQLSDSLLADNPNCKILIMGDLNDDPSSKSLTKVLRAVKDEKAMKADELFNTMYENYDDGNGTLAYRDAWNLFDQIIISKGMVSKRTGGWFYYKPVVFRQSWLIQPEGNYKGYPLRTFSGDTFLNGYSDHLPVYVYFMKKL